jgi:hypothetical protein
LGFLVAIAMAVSCLAAMAILPAMLYVSRPGFVFAHRVPADKRIEDLAQPVTPAR